jgi:hypothetical protein
MMFRIAACIFIIALLSVCSAHSQNLGKGQVSASSADKLDGVYEFVSESTILTKPRNTTYKRTSSEWVGVWQFQNGHYTRVLMKRRRDNFFNPKKLDDLGFESFAGSYKIEGENVLLKQSYALNPLNVDGSVLMAYRIDGDTLTLIQTLHPYIEDLREGTITTVLRRLK